MVVYPTDIAYFSPLPAELVFHVNVESSSIPRPPDSYDYVSWSWPMWLKRKSAGNFCKTFSLLKQKCLWQVLSSPYSFYLFSLWTLLLKGTQVGAGAGIRGGILTWLDGSSEKCKTPGSLMTLLSSHTIPFSLILDFFLKLKYVYATSVVCTCYLQPKLS